MPESVPDLLIEGLALGDLDPETEASVRARLSADQTPLAEIATSNRAILAAHPPDRVVEEVQRRVRASRAVTVSAGVRPVWPGLALGTAAVALALVVVLPGQRARGPSGQLARSWSPETITHKGLRPHLVVYRRAQAGPEPLDGGSRLRPGDTLQVAYVAAGMRFGVVASQDAQGEVTVLLPTGPSAQAAPLSQAGETPTAQAFELDERPGFERFIFVTADEPFAIASVREALRSGERGKLPPGTRSTELRFPKDVP